MRWALSRTTRKVEPVRDEAGVGAGDDVTAVTLDLMSAGSQKLTWR
jgi:hypothetical protein